MFRSFHQGRALLRALIFAVALAAAPALAGTLSGELNVNTASVEELTLLPGVGEKLAARIIKLRERRDGFQQVDDLLGVRGIGEKNFARMRPFVVVEGESTLAVE